MFKFYEDYLEKVVIGLIPGIKPDQVKVDNVLSSAQLHLILMILVGFTALIGLPSLITWGKIVKYVIKHFLN